MKLPLVLLIPLSASALTAGCAQHASCPSQSPAEKSAHAQARGERHFYRLDFVLAASDGATPATSTSFTLNLPEHERGEVVIGKNIPLQGALPPPPPAGASAMPLGVPRQDIGTKVVVDVETEGDDAWLQVSTEISAAESPSIHRKMVMRSAGIATPGKSALVSMLDDNGKHYELSVTPTKLR
jgi:hypothetical protein